MWCFFVLFFFPFLHMRGQLRRQLWLSKIYTPQILLAIPLWYCFRETVTAMLNIYFGSYLKSCFLLMIFLVVKLLLHDLSCPVFILRSNSYPTVSGMVAKRCNGLKLMNEPWPPGSSSLGHLPHACSQNIYIGNWGRIPKNCFCDIYGKDLWLRVQHILCKLLTLPSSPVQRNSTILLEIFKKLRPVKLFYVELTDIMNSLLWWQPFYSGTYNLF